MYKLSGTTDLAFLSKQQLQMLCFAAYSVYLHFADGIMITIEGSFEHISRKNGKKSQHFSFPIAESKLMRLVTHHLESFEAQPDGTLCLEFSNGDTLIIKGDNGPYESYQIQHPGGRIIV